MHQPIDDHFLLKYRALLDAEDLAFDELEPHTCVKKVTARSSTRTWSIGRTPSSTSWFSWPTPGSDLKLPVLG